MNRNNGIAWIAIAVSMVSIAWNIHDRWFRNWTNNQEPATVISIAVIGFKNASLGDFNALLQAGFAISHISEDSVPADQGNRCSGLATLVTGKSDMVTLLRNLKTETLEVDAISMMVDRTGGRSLGKLLNKLSGAGFRIVLTMDNIVVLELEEENSSTGKYSEALERALM